MGCIDQSRLVWHKSSRSTSQSNCVEVAGLEHGNVAVRDSKDVCGPELGFSRGHWSAFVALVKRGSLDL
jgi:hypothetical protein